jgi:hypothetical protein
LNRAAGRKTEGRLEVSVESAREISREPNPSVGCLEVLLGPEPEVLLEADAPVLSLDAGELLGDGVEMDSLIVVSSGFG